MLGLPSGQAVAAKLGVPPLSDEILWSAGSRLLDPAKLSGGDKTDFDHTTKARADVYATWKDAGLENSAPLWYYIPA